MVVGKKYTEYNFIRANDLLFVISARINRLITNILFL